MPGRKTIVDRRIRVAVVGCGRIAANHFAAIEKHADYVKAETLAVSLTFAAPPANASVVEDEFEGEKVKVGLVKAAK